MAADFIPFPPPALAQKSVGPWAIARAGGATLKSVLVSAARLG